MIILYPAFLFPVHKCPRGTPSNSAQPRTVLYHATLTSEERLDICRYTKGNCWLGSFLHNWHRWSSGRTSFVAFCQMEGQIRRSPWLDTRVPVGSRMLQRFHFGILHGLLIQKLLVLLQMNKNNILILHSEESVHCFKIFKIQVNGF